MDYPLPLRQNNNPLTNNRTRIMITPTQHEKNEWTRMAQAAYGADRNSVGHRYSGAASIVTGARIPTSIYDSLQSDYRAWLIRNEFPNE